jgi:hypothetical protein
MEEKRNKSDYAAIIREYRMYGGSGSMKRFCEENDYNYPNVNHYSRKHIWDRFSLPKKESNPSHQGSSGEVYRREYLKSNIFALLLRKSLLITKI